MNKGVNCEGAGREAGRLILIVIPAHSLLAFMERRIRMFLLFIMSHPLINHILKLVNLCASNLELEALEDYLLNK
jgi:hypothetical protein